jgi:hypothetical protein
MNVHMDDLKICMLNSVAVIFVVRNRFSKEQHTCSSYVLSEQRVHFLCSEIFYRYFRVRISSSTKAIIT